MYPRPFGPYLLLERLGAGGMSEVDLAQRAVEEAGFVRFVVIKRIKTDRLTDPSFVRMFKDEARITAELHHAHIGQVYDFGRHEDEWYLALEYVPGVDVRHLIHTLQARQQRVPVKVALRILCDVLDALEYAHGKRDALGRPMSIVHRDVNPRNIMVSVHGDAKLIDFGVAKAADRLERTRTDHVKGKFTYMAPEQIGGDAVDHRADLYAVGLCLHELLSGASPYFGMNQLQILHHMTSGKIPAMPPVPELPYPDGLRRVHEKALQAKAADRYQDARAFRDDLEAVARQVGGLPSRDGVARFLHQVDPTSVDRIRARLSAHARLEDSASEPTEPITSQEGRPLEERSASGLDRSEPARRAPQEPTLVDIAAGQGAPIERTSTSVTRTSVLAGSLLAVSLGSAVAGAALAAIALGGVWVAWQVPPEAAPVPVAPLEEPARSEPAPVEVVEAIERPEEVAPEPPSPVPSRAAPAPTPTLAPEQPAPQPAMAEPPIEVPPSAPPRPAPEAPKTTLRVSSPQKGLAIRIDGQPTGAVTPAELSWTVGAWSVEVEGYPAQQVTLKPGQPKTVTFR